VVHPRREIFVYDAPGGVAIARLRPHQLGDTWVPVIKQQPGWVRVLLPSKPDGSTGWVTDMALDRAYTPYLSGCIFVFSPWSCSRGASA
jgi:hypothetical protein